MEDKIKDCRAWFLENVQKIGEQKNSIIGLYKVEEILVDQERGG
jgi:hypothetical protein